jgi:hypothetical protein
MLDVLALLAIAPSRLAPGEAGPCERAGRDRPYADLKRGVMDVRAAVAWQAATLSAVRCMLPAWQSRSAGVRGPPWIMRSPSYSGEGVAPAYFL